MPIKDRMQLTAAQDGLDPFTHFFYMVGHRSYRRICDDAPWVGGARYQIPPNADCSRCRGMLAEDRRYGRSMFKLTRVPKGHLYPRLDDVLYNEGDQFSVKAAGAMKPIHQETFSDFRLTKSEDKRRRIVLQYLGLAKAEPGGGPDCFAPLRTAFGQLNGTVDSLRSRPPRPEPWCRNRYADAYTEITKRMIAFCDEFNGKPYAVPPTQVAVGGAVITVEADLCIAVTILGDRQKWAVKLWWQGARMPDSRADVVGFLLDEARRTQAHWEGRYPHLWPIRRASGPQLRLPSNAEREECVRAGRDFMEWCSRLNCQAPLMRADNNAEAEADDED